MLGKFEEKIDNIKKKIDPKWASVIFFMVFTAVVFVAVEMGNNFKRQKNQVQDEYNKSMYEMVGYVQNVSYELAKLEVSSTDEFIAVSLSNIWKQSNLAKANLESLPIEQSSMANSSKFLAQVSDFSYTLMKKTIAGDGITKSERDEINKIYEESKSLADVMNEVYNDLNDGRINWDELSHEGNDKLKDADVENVSSILKIGKTFQEYEGLIYDGAFSDHMLSSTPKLIENENEVSKEDAKKYIEDLYKDSQIESLEELEDSSGKVDLYNFNLKLKDKDYVKMISITKKGCKLYSMISNRNIENSNISMDEAKKKGLEFLSSLGIDDIKDNYYLTMDNFAIINYAAVQDGVTLYPDLIKLKIALDDGEILSVEAQGYIFNHTKRENLAPKLSLDEARSVLNSDINVMSSGLAVIPTESGGEIFTYEFKGKIDEREFLVYINADEKKEEKVLLIMDTPGGILTM